MDKDSYLETFYVGPSNTTGRAIWCTTVVSSVGYGVYSGYHETSCKPTRKQQRVWLREARKEAAKESIF